MANESLNCWHCGHGLDALPLPLGRREECPRCSASLHVCRMCVFYDTSVSKDCREPMADEVAHKEQANFCDYFRPQGGLAGGSDAEAADARARLEALFGGAGEGSASDATEAARRRLESAVDKSED